MKTGRLEQLDTTIGVACGSIAVLLIQTLGCGSDRTYLDDSAANTAAGSPPQGAPLNGNEGAGAAPGSSNAESGIAAADPRDVLPGGNGTVDVEPGSSPGDSTPAELPFPDPAPPDAGGDAGLELPPEPPLPPLVPGLTEHQRAAPFLNMPARGQVTLPGYDMTDVFPALTFRNATFLSELPGSGRLFVSERPGRIYAFENRPDVTQATLMLDISDRTMGNGDRGLVGFAFHPEFGDPESPHRGHVYVHYPHADPEIERPLPDTLVTHSRLSRFSVDLETFQADPTSELVLIDQFDQSPLHLGGALFFHPADGYLYLTVGDEGISCARSANCGRIDKDLFSGVLRIDVDPNEDADSHAIPRQPEAGMTANYTIPNDNPFVGRANALEEFYAIGVRSPHRMTYDETDDIIWLGDVGGTVREEIDVVTPGANFQWGDAEGFFSHRAPAGEVVGVWKDPVLDFTRSEARCIVGGYVYRGQRFPELVGKYVFADFIYNTLWALDYGWDGERVEVLQNQRLATSVAGRRESLTSLGVDAAGELYMTSLGTNRIKTLTFRDGTSTNLPTRLAETGVFDDLVSLTANAGLLGYSVQSPLWSDGATKQRWISLPSGTSIGFATQGPWTFPEGTVFVKHFEMAMDERAPEQRRRLETRVLVAASGGTYYGAAYKWNTEGTDASLVFESQVEPLEIVQADGSTRTQEYFYPSSADCLTCHNTSAGYVLGVRSAQLNGDRRYEQTSRVANQVRTWSELGMFDRLLTDAEVRALPSLAALDDESRSVEDRVRSYWDSNCSMCHGVVPGMRANWDARYQTPLADQRVILAASVETDAAFVVVPGDVDASLMAVRDRATDPNLRMPPLGRTRADAEYVALLERWIRSLGVAATTP